MLKIGANDKLRIPPDNTNNRIILEIKIEEIPTIAVIDTGAPYLILAPSVSSRLAMENTSSLERTAIEIRGLSFTGNLFRVLVLLPARDGNSHSFEATAFIPDENQEEKWGKLPTYLGVASCLDRIRFAIDPGLMEFHFGTIP